MMKYKNKIISIAICMSMTMSTMTWATVGDVIEAPPLNLETLNQESVESTSPRFEGPGITELEVVESEAVAPELPKVDIEDPVIAAQGAALINASTGQVLFEKNGYTQYYPASITKVMTALIVLENCALDEVVTFSKTATTNLESGSVSLGIVEGDKLTVEQALYGFILKSANEIGNGLAEHVAGSNAAFAELMNAKAKELGCLNTNFVNPHGLNDSAHKTTPYDMALILSEAMENETFCKINNTFNYQFPATKEYGVRTISITHKMLDSDNTSYYYPGIVAGKTGYTSLAGNTLVTGVERDGVRLVAVVMKSSSTHYTDTKALLDYGFTYYDELVDDTIVQKQWAQDTNGWQYIKADGTKASNEWVTIDGLVYWFDENTYMATGWRNFADGAWYYFKPEIGYRMENQWIWDTDSWYYIGEGGLLLTNATTPDGCKVNEYGIWVQ